MSFLKEILSSIKSLLQTTVPSFPRMRHAQESRTQLAGVSSLVREQIDCLIAAL